MDLNLYQPILQTGGGVSTFFRTHRGAASAAALVNHDDCDCVDKQFGPFFLKFCSYVPNAAQPQPIGGSQELQIEDGLWTAYPLPSICILQFVICNENLFSTTCAPVRA